MFFSFKIHDLLHDLALFVAKDDCLLISSQVPSIAENVRNLSCPGKDLFGKSFKAKSVGVRTILFPNAGVGASGEAFFRLVSRYKYLKILDLSDSTFETLPRSIRKFKHLGYLDLHDIRKLRGFLNPFVSSKICSS